MNEVEKEKFNYYNNVLGGQLSEVEKKDKYIFWKKHIFYNKVLEKQVKEYEGYENFEIFRHDFNTYCVDTFLENSNSLVDKHILDINKNIDDLIIFKLDESFESKLDNNKLDIILPFNNIYIDTSINFDDGISLYRINGFVLKKSPMGSYYNYEIFYIVGDAISDLQYPVVMPFINGESFDLPVSDSVALVDNSGKSLHHLAEHLRDKMKTILVNLMNRINTKQYSEYYKLEDNKYIRKEIVYASKKSYKMHFWKDSGRYINIYLMSKEELIDNGYGNDELVFRGNELRYNVPFKIIDEQHKEKGKKNKILDLRRKRVWRQEEKIYTILRELYPNKIIRRHDRKTLKGIELDFNLPELRLGIEYDGEQHFDKELYEKLYGEGFEAQVKRDRKKDRLCIKKMIKLVRIKYDEKINKTNIKNKIKEVLN